MCLIKGQIILNLLWDFPHLGLFNMFTVLLLYLDLVFYARLSFAFCCICMIFSIFLFLQEIRLSNEALKFHLSDMDSMKRDL